MFVVLQRAAITTSWEERREGAKGGNNVRGGEKWREKHMGREKGAFSPYKNHRRGGYETGGSRGGKLLENLIF